MRTVVKKRPLYQELRNRIAQDIANTRYPAGSELPSLSEMSAMYAVSPGTVGHVITILADEGLIKCRRGRRPRVLPAGNVHRNFRIAVLLDCHDRDCIHDYADGPWAWTLHQEILRRLLEDHNPALNLSYRYDWENHLDNIDGVVALEAYRERLHAPDKLLAYNIPCIRIASFLPEMPQSNTISLDYSRSMRQIATYFLANGVRNFFINDIDPPQPELADHGSRFSELNHPLEEHGVPPESRTHFYASLMEFTTEHRTAIRNYFQTHPEPIGALLAGDLRARQFIEIALECGRVLKKDVFTVGASGLPEYAMASPALSSLDIPFADMANRAIDMLYDMIRHKTMSCANVSLPVKFHPRET